MAALAGTVIWVKGDSQPEITLLGGSWEGMATNPRPLLLWPSASVPPPAAEPT